tara:strand:+ start:4056 stop:4646 length:591 start_codon:yes stop_codon:yes gene_type:complete
MTSSIEFYFDFISPYSYIAHKRYLEIKKDKKINFIYKPILLGGLHNLAKITAPGLIKSKIKYLKDDCAMVSKKFSINFKFNNRFPINTLTLMRGILAIDESKKQNYIDKFFEAYWYSNTNLSDEKEIAKILKDLDINPKKFFLDVKNQNIKDKLKELTSDAFKKKIFGAPTFYVNNKIFWGQDRLDYALEEVGKTI